MRLFRQLDGDLDSWLCSRRSDLASEVTGGSSASAGGVAIAESTTFRFKQIVVVDTIGEAAPTGEVTRLRSCVELLFIHCSG